MTWSEWRKQPDAMDRIADALRHGRTLAAFCAEQGFARGTVISWIRLTPARRQAYEAVRKPRGRPTKLDAACKSAVGAKHPHGSLQALSSFLGVNRGSLYNWGARRTGEGA